MGTPRWWESEGSHASLPVSGVYASGVGMDRGHRDMAEGLDRRLARARCRAASAISAAQTAARDGA